MIKVSVIIPVYNVKPYLDRCIQSVLHQTLKDMEIILVNDGSTDGSGELADVLAMTDSRIKVIHQENHGLSVARNVGLHAASGEYIIFLDSDDEWLLPDGLETMLRESKTGVDLIVFKRVDFWKQGRRDDSEDYDIEVLSKLPDGPAVFAYLVKTQQFQISACFLMTRRQVLMENEIFFPAGYADEDVSWNLRLWQFVKTVSFYNLPFYGYYHRADSLTTTHSLHVYRSNDRILTNWEASCLEGCVNSASILSFLANIWVTLGYRVHVLKDEEKPEAIAILRRHKSILRYATTPKTCRTAFLVKLFGIKGTSAVLGVYWRLRTIIKGNVV